jgi:hypothetical protein
MGSARVSRGRFRRAETVFWFVALGLETWHDESS